MFLALVTYHLYHPGKVLTGPDSEPGLTKEEKALKKQHNVEAKKEKRRLRQEQGDSGNSSTLERDAESGLH
jgi:hypothetical protein